MAESKSQKVCDYIENKIMLEEYKPGTKLPSESKLCERLDVSRVSVRSGIERLISIGLLRKEKYGGTYVTKQHQDNYLRVLTPTFIHNFDYLEMLELRQALDSLAIELCMEHTNEEFINELKKLLVEMENFKEQDNFFNLDRKFHLTISKYSHNSLLHNINEIMWEVLSERSKDQYHMIGNDKRIIEHTQILDAIINNDYDLAKLYSVRHMKRTLYEIKNGN